MSGTSKKTDKLGPETPIQYLKGVGPRLAELLARKGIRTIRDAVFYLPRDYQDRSTIQPIATLRHEQVALVRGQVTGHRFVPIRKLRRPMVEARIEDGSGASIGIKWFQYNRAWLDSKLTAKPSLIAYGTVRAFGDRLGMVHPDIEWEPESPTGTKGPDAPAGGIVPLYSETEGLNQKILRKIVGGAVRAAAHALPDEIPEPVRRLHRLVELSHAVMELHAPGPGAKVERLRAFETPEQRRLIFDELFKFEWVVGRRRLNLRRESTKPYPATAGQAALANLVSRVPFELTTDQRNAIARIHEDIAGEKAMSRLLQGDVGCGKTLVALAACAPVIGGGGQATLMAPTEILAEQHLKTARELMEGVALLTGSTPKLKRERVLEDLAQGRVSLLIGTHALLEDPVRFRELGLVVIDEQHRFGVDQRMRLRAKGSNPHSLLLTATPIPRTLALTAYGDLDVTVIRELPKGRPEIRTRVLRQTARGEALEAARRELALGRQAYVIYPLVEESEKIDLANAVEGARELEKGALKGWPMGLLHGRLKAAEKSAVMESFKRGELRALVSTTVVEVGVDVPNATVLIVEHAERFGLSQLHQLRGRVGRGTELSHCFLVTAGGPGTAYERLKAMERTRDGFKLAELDLEIRGPGEFLGTRQSGELQFRYASLTRDQLILQEARQAAFTILKTDPELSTPEHAPLRDYMRRQGYLEEKRFETA